MRKMFVATCIALLPMLLLASTAFADSVAAEMQEQLPFKGAMQAVEVGTVNFPTLVVEASGSGNATQLGLFALYYEAIVQLSPNGPGISSLSAHFVAANGDNLFAKGSGEGFPTETPNVIRIVELYTITGGTGRFAGATGSFTLERRLDRATGVTSGTFDGNIVISTENQ